MAILNIPDVENMDSSSSSVSDDKYLGRQGDLLKMAFPYEPGCQNFNPTFNALPVVPYRGPPPVHIQQAYYSATTGKTVTLVCTLSSSHPITSHFCWRRIFGQSITTISCNTNTNKYTCNGSTPTTLSLTIFYFDQNDVGQYTCFASNFAGTVQSFPITLSPPTLYIPEPSHLVPSGNTVTLVCIVTSVLPIEHVYWERHFGGTITPIYFTTNSNKYSGSTPNNPSLTIFCDGQNDAGQYTCFASNFLGTGQSLPITLTLRIPLRDITCSQKLGEGQFGEVFLGFWNYKKVAIKTLKQTQVQIGNISFMTEAQQMTKISHPNIVALFGICLENYMMVLEYMEHGDLLNYLRKHRHNARFNNQFYVVTLPIIQLYHIAKQISAGMVYLASHGFVHRDLAARNCLVGNFNHVKIGDFGLCRELYNTDFYQATNSAMLPFNWMAPESVHSRIFTVKSDVWSFGVLLWEIFTYGEPWLGPNTKQPCIFPNTVNEILNGCWKLNPEERLTMIEVHEKIEMSEML